LKKTGRNERGAYIRLREKSDQKIKGELISADSKELRVLTGKAPNKKMVVIPKHEVDRFKIKFAKPKSYWWAVPVFTAATAAHGVFLIFSAPANLIVTITTAVSSSSDVRFTDEDLSFGDLNMYARFPQGIPSQIDLSDIR
jgi:hypothetical protein